MKNDDKQEVVRDEDEGTYPYKASTDTETNDIAKQQLDTRPNIKKDMIQTSQDPLTKKEAEDQINDTNKVNIKDLENQKEPLEVNKKGTTFIQQKPSRLTNIKAPSRNDKEYKDINFDKSKLIDKKELKDTDMDKVEKYKVGLDILTSILDMIGGAGAGFVGNKWDSLYDKKQSRLDKDYEDEVLERDKQNQNKYKQNQELLQLANMNNASKAMNNQNLQTNQENKFQNRQLNDQDYHNLYKEMLQLYGLELSDKHHADDFTQRERMFLEELKTKDNKTPLDDFIVRLLNSQQNNTGQNQDTPQEEVKTIPPKEPAAKPKEAVTKPKQNSNTVAPVGSYVIKNNKQKEGKKEYHQNKMDK